MSKNSATSRIYFVIEPNSWSHDYTWVPLSESLFNTWHQHKNTKNVFDMIQDTGIDDNTIYLYNDNSDNDTEPISSIDTDTNTVYFRHQPCDFESSSILYGKFNSDKDAIQSLHDDGHIWHSLDPCGKDSKIFRKRPIFTGKHSSDIDLGRYGLRVIEESKSNNAYCMCSFDINEVSIEDIVKKNVAIRCVKHSYTLALFLHKREFPIHTLSINGFCGKEVDLSTADFDTGCSHCKTYVDLIDTRNI